MVCAPSGLNVGRDRGPAIRLPKPGTYLTADINTPLGLSRRLSARGSAVAKAMADRQRALPDLDRANTGLETG